MTNLEIDELFRKLKPVLGDKIDRLWLLYKVDPESRNDIEGMLHILASEHLDESYEKRKVLLAPPPPEIADGEYPIGTVIYGDREICPFGLREKELTLHSFIGGISGSGKSMTGFNIVKNLLKHDKPFMVFDWKRSWRDILQWPEASNVRVYTVGRSDVSPFHFNVLIPPAGTSTSVWLKLIIDVMMHNYYLGEGVASLLQKAFDNAYRDASPQEGKWPTLADVKRWLEKYPAKGRQGQWMDSALRALDALCYGQVGEVFNSANPHDITDLLKEQVIFELDDLNNADKGFFIQSMLLWMHRYRLQESGREVSLKHVLIIEEAHHVLLKGTQGRETIMDVIFRECRELGEAILFIDQCPSLISIPALANSYCTIGMNLKHGRDVSSLSRAMLLKDDEKDYLGKLPVGYGIIRLQGRWQRPFLVKFPLLPIVKGVVTDTELRRRNGRLSASGGDIPASQAEVEVIPPPPPADKIRAENLKEEENKLLADIADHPFSSISSRYSRLCFSCSVGEKTKQSLLKRGIIKISKIKTPKGQIKLLEPTEEGERIMESMGLALPSRKGNESIEHDFWKHRIAQLFKEKGYSVAIEEPIEGGGAVDIAVRKGGKNFAFEIETGKSEPTENIRKDIEGGFSNVVTVALNYELKSKLDRWLKQQPSELSSRIHILTPKNMSEIDKILAA